MNDHQFRPPCKDDSVQDIIGKLQLIMNEIRNKTKGRNVPMTGIWMDIWAIIAKFLVLGMDQDEGLRASAK